VITALAGGVGAARLLRGLVRVVPPAQVTAVVNTGDDTVLHGLRISPDLDTVTYTLAGAINPETGWGLVDETWRAMDSLRAYGDGRLAWFNLGDRDLGTHLYRTSRLAEGAALHEVTREIGQRWGVAVRILPMSDDPVSTRIVLAGPPQREVAFQEYFVGLHHEVAVAAVRFEGVGTATAGPGVLDAVERASRIVICPSNPILSIGPVLATGGIGAALAARRHRTVAVSPIVGGRALKGPADRLLAELGHESSVAGVARLWSPYAATLVVDEADAGQAAEVEATGMRCVVAPTVMHGPTEAAELARVVLDVAPVAS